MERHVSPNTWLEQVFFRQHVRCAKAVMSVCGPKLRQCLEIFCCFVAVSATLLLVGLHLQFVNRPLAPLAVELGRAVGTLERAHGAAFAVRVAVSEERCGCGVVGAAGVGADDAVYWWSRDKGVVTLGAAAREALRVPTATVRCGVDALGGSAALTRAAGSDCVVANAAVAALGPSGYVLSERSNEFYDLARAERPAPLTREALGASLAVVLKTVFLIFATSTLVSYTLRETQARMLRFSYELKATIGSRQSYLSLVTTHLLDSAVFAPIMIGMMAFLFEFFADQVLGLLVLTLAWMVELFAAVSLRSRKALDHLPHLLILLLAALYIYLFKFPFGFKYVALLAAIAAIGHAMLFFWNHYEIAALRNGDVSVTTLRDRPVYQRPTSLSTLAPRRDRPRAQTTT